MPTTVMLVKFAVARLRPEQQVLDRLAIVGPKLKQQEQVPPQHLLKLKH